MIGLGEALSIGSSILGGMGKGKGKGATSQSGFVTLPGEQKDFASGEVWDAIKKYFGTGYQGLPKRRINAEDTDPIFGSRARMDLQQYYDAMAGQGQAGETAPDATGGGGLAALGRVMALQMAGQGGMYGTKTTQPWENFMQRATDADYSKLAKTGGRPGQGLYSGTMVDDKGIPVQGLAQILANYRSK